MSVCSEWSDGMAWAGKHFMPCSVHPDQLDTYKCKICDRKNISVQVAVCYPGYLKSMSMCTHLWNSCLPVSKYTHLNWRASLNQYAPWVLLRSFNLHHSQEGQGFVLASVAPSTGLLKAIRTLKTSIVIKTLSLIIWELWSSKLRVRGVKRNILVWSYLALKIYVVLLSRAQSSAGLCMLLFLYSHVFPWYLGGLFLTSFLPQCLYNLLYPSIIQSVSFSRTWAKMRWKEKEMLSVGINGCRKRAPWPSANWHVFIPWSAMQQYLS